jgi:hypothetical protein
MVEIALDRFVDLFKNLNGAIGSGAGTTSPKDGEGNDHGGKFSRTIGEDA